MLTLTRRQEQVLSILMLSFEVYRTTPTVRKLGAMIGGITESTVYSHLDALRKKGYLVIPKIRALYVPTGKADLWWAERKHSAQVEADREVIWQADRALVGGREGT